MYAGQFPNNHDDKILLNYYKYSVKSTNILQSLIYNGVKVILFCPKRFSLRRDVSYGFL
jgi:hypothetical protein